MNYKYLIIGGGIAGTTAAETIRSADKDGSIIIITDEPYPLYSRVMLSKQSFLLEDFGLKIWLKTAKWYQDNQIEYFPGKPVTAIDTARKTVACGKDVIGYEKLLLASGVHARKWEVPGADKTGVFYLRTLDQARDFAFGIKGKKRAAVIGSGGVAFEVIENLCKVGLEVNVVMLEKYFWEPMLDEEAGKLVEKILTKNKVKIFRKTKVREVLGEGRVTGILTEQGNKIDCELVLCGIGVVFSVDFAKTGGIRVQRGIVANEYLETSAQDVWVAGDVAEYQDIILHESCMMGNWMNAREQGRIAGLNMTGRKERFRLVSSCGSHAFGLSVIFVGDIRILPGRKSIGRGSPTEGSHARVILQNGKIMGAALVNRVQEFGPITKLIESGTDVSAKQSELADPKFDLNKLF